MALFTYTGRNSAGDAVSGTLEGETPGAVADQLLRNGVTPLKIAARAAPRSGLGEGLKRYFQPKVRLEEIVMLSRQLRTLIKAGVPILRALNGLAETARNMALRGALQDVHHQLQSGRELNAALSQHRGIFSPMFIALVKVGENTGRLDEAFGHLADYLELEKSTREKIQSAMRYPMIVLGAIVIAVVIINIMVIPAFADAFSRYNAELPLMTRLLIGSSRFFTDYWQLLLAGLAGASLMFRQWIRTTRGNYLWSKWLLRIPLTGPILHKSILGRFAQSLSLSLKSGVPLVQALNVVGGVVDNAYVAERIGSMREGIEKGESIARTANATGLFTPLVLQMIAVGEESGALDHLLDETAEHYQAEVEFEMKRLSDAIEPIVIVIIGIMVAVLALGVFLPLWDLSAAARG